jgi:hypothetical protein
MPTPDQLLNAATRNKVARIFRDHGVDAEVFVATPLQADEIVFVVGPVATLPEATLTRTLMDELHRKVWVTTNSDMWRDQLEPLVSHG